MPRFFVPSLDEDHILIDGPDARHIAKSLRMQPGDQLTLCDGRGTDALCRLLHVDAAGVDAEILSRTENRSEPRVRLRLFQAWPKGDKLDLIVQKAVELGAAEIIPVMTSRCISRPDGKSQEKKCGRLSATALEAAKQSGRGVIPTIGAPLHFPGALSGMKTDNLAILCYEGATASLRETLQQHIHHLDVAAPTLSLLIGSEGGFSPEEAEAATAAGILPVSLGARILRCETAPLCALSCILYELGEI